MYWFSVFFYISYSVSDWSDDDDGDDDDSDDSDDDKDDDDEDREQLSWVAGERLVSRPRNVSVHGSRELSHKAVVAPYKTLPYETLP